MKTLIFGGNFNPPTIAHRAIASHICNDLFSPQEVRVIIAPSFKSRDNKTDEVGFLYKIDMCHLNFVGISKFASPLISDVEEKLYNKNIDNDSKGSMYNLLEYYSNKYDSNKIYVVIGLDQAIRIQTWFNSKKLIDTYKFIVIDRKGYSAEESCWFIKNPHRYIAINLPEASSTKARENIKKGDKSMLTSNVYEYIKQNKLYGVKI
jgi:nicotinate-nucleotide adenylyltransferase